MKKALQLKISLNGSKPLIWRRVLVREDMTFASLGQAIQVVMEWDGSHLAEFNVPGVGSISSPGFFDDEWDEGLDGNEILIGQYLNSVGDTALYIYDFGDNWTHRIRVEKILPIKNDMKYPLCIAGKRNSPPEDCGGLWGYSDLLDALKDKNNNEHEEVLDWLGEDFDPEFFDMDLVNKELKETFES